MFRIFVILAAMMFVVASGGLSTAVAKPPEVKAWSTTEWGKAYMGEHARVFRAPPDRIRALTFAEEFAASDLDRKIEMCGKLKGILEFQTLVLYADLYKIAEKYGEDPSQISLRVEDYSQHRPLSVVWQELCPLLPDPDEPSEDI